MTDGQPLAALPPGTLEPVLGHLTAVDPREVWPHEAHDFTPWLKLNADRLAEALGIDIEFEDIEHPVGEFSLDVLGMDTTHGKRLIVENQLAASDHSHLGQLLTYAAGTNAATIVWIAPMIRAEHRQALQWMNEQTGPDTHFFGVELRVVKIGDSVPAPLFDPVVQPNDWQKSVRAATVANSASGRSVLYAEFWEQFLTRVQNDRPAWSRAKGPVRTSWFNMSVGMPAGCTTSAAFTRDGKLTGTFYIDRATTDECKTLFDALHAQRERFEEEYGRALDWQRLDGKKACRIADSIDGTVDNADMHQAYIDFLVDSGDRMRKALDAVELG